MGGKSSSDTSTSQTQTGTASATTAPWLPTQGILQNLIGGISGLSTSPNAAQTQGTNQLVSNAQSMPDYGAQATSAVNGLLGSLPQGVQSAYQDYSRQISPIATQNNDPMQTPGMQQLLQTIQGDVGNQVNGMFAGAGRDLSGLNQQTLARGIAQGEAAPLLAQYNQNVSNQMGAAGNLFNAAGSNANTQAGLLGAGLSAAGQVPGIINQNANNLISAGNAQYMLPAQNLGILSGLTLPIAGLGSQNSGTTSMVGSGTSHTDNQMSGAQQFGLISGGLANLWSDRRLKSDIRRIGTTAHDLPLYEYTIFGERKRGVMADEAEVVMPEAVIEHPNVLMMNCHKKVNYQMLGIELAELEVA